VPLLAVRGVAKAFGGVPALRGVDLEVAAGEIVAVLGENGAGKSTLMKVIAGLEVPDAGALWLAGQPAPFGDAAAARRHGIALIHQELSLCDNLTLAGALFLGQEWRRGPFLRERAMQRAARERLRQLGLELDPQTLVAALSPGQRQLLEIARAMAAEARVLIMDEPTSSLSEREVERLFEVVRGLQRQGCGILYISHRLREIAVLADRVVGLRDGRNSGELQREEVTHEALVGLMVGRQLDGRRRLAHAPGEVVLEVRGLRTQSAPRHAVDLEVRAGEVVGLAGLLGAGRSEVLRALYGVDARLAGQVRVAGELLPAGQPAAAIARGLVLVPEDRKRHGLILPDPVRQNLSLPTLAQRGRWLDAGYEAQLAQRSIAELGIATASAELAVGRLSGGNQQKVVLGRWLAAQPKVLLLDEPTRGVDVGARAEIHARLHALAGAGLGLLLVSSELEELLLLADRVLVLHQGRLAGELSAAQCSEAAIMLLATGKEPA
jgi:ribose transport system ATP-binding protein